jgi:hypothetical protein
MSAKDIQKSDYPKDNNGYPGKNNEINPGPGLAGNARYQRIDHDENASIQRYGPDEAFLILTQLHINPIYKDLEKLEFTCQ